MDSYPRILTCVYCGHEYPQDTPSHGNKVLTDHIAVCEKHPMASLVRYTQELGEAVYDLLSDGRGTSLEDLELMAGTFPGHYEAKERILRVIKILQKGGKLKAIYDKSDASQV